MRSVWFHKGLFGETWRLLMWPALMLTALAAVLSFVPFLLVVYGGWVVDTIGNPSLLAAPVLPYVPFVAAPLLTLIALRFQASKRGSDFYFSLPLPKTAILLTRLTAVAVWLLVIVLVTAVIGELALGMTAGASFSAVRVLSESGAVWMASLFVAAITALSSALCGTTLNAFLTAAMLLAAPRLIAYTLVSVVSAASPFLTPDNGRVLLDAVSQNLLYGGYSSPLTWAVTALKLALVTGLAVWFTHRRPSETAGKPTVHPALHVVLRLLVGVLAFLPALLNLVPYRSYKLAEGLFFCFLAVVVYYLYELVLTRSAKGLLRATKWLPLTAAVCIALYGGCQGLAGWIADVELTAETVDSVSVTRIVYRESDLVFEMGYGYDRDYDHDNFTTETFYSLTRRYATEGDAPQVRLADERSLGIACEALARQPVGPYEWDPHGSTIHLYTEEEPPTVAFLADIEFRQGLFTHTRRVALTDTELRRLLSRIEKQTALPAGMDLIFDNNLACPFDFESYYGSDLDGDGYVEGDYAFPPAIYGLE